MIREKILANYFWRRPTVTLKSNHCEKHFQYFLFALWYIKDLSTSVLCVAGVRPYKCNLCEKSFTQRCSLESHCLKVHGVAHQYEYKQRRSKVYVCEDCGHTTKEPEVHYVHLKEQHPYSPALLKFYDKRHFKFNNTNFASNLITPAM